MMKPTRIRRRHFLGAVAAAGGELLAADFQSQWPAGEQRPWLGAEYWSNPMQDWRQRNGRIECVGAGGDRNVFLLTRDVSARQGDLSMSVRLGRLEEDTGPLEDGFAGFRLAIRGDFNDWRDSAVHGTGVNAGIAADGRLFFGTLESGAPKISAPLSDLELRLKAVPAGNAYDVILHALDPQGKTLAEVSRKAVPADWLTGGVALVSSSGPVAPTPQPRERLQARGNEKRGTQRGGAVRFWFRDWKVSGAKVDAHPDRSFGPIYFALHTLSRRVLKLTAQMAPVATAGQSVRLQVNDSGRWRTVATSPIDPLSRTATFRVPNWDDSRDHPYRVAYQDQTYEGTVRKDPKGKPKIVIGALTCNNDFGFPHQDIVRNLRHFAPDVLVYTGDQIYERIGEYGIQREPLEPASLDYLRKWAIFGWGYRDLFRDIPTITIPDDHDVYHGNLWGAGGKKADAPGPEVPANERTKFYQDSGGYTMPAEWVNAVQRTQTSHLPDPFDPKPVDQGITVYYAHMLYGGVSLAILEDRKWKSAPRVAVPFADIRNGWAQNPKYDAARDGDVPGAQLLGPRQEEFLERWASDWSGGAWIKAVVSQTIFTNLATLPPPANNDDVTPGLPVLAPGEYPEGEVPVADHDSNGWPQSPRTRALRAMRKAKAFHIAGDQHLGSTIQYGIDDWNDGPWAICTPAVANIWPRRWYPPKEGRNRKPGAPKYCGEFLDGFGNKVTVHAVSNPMKYGAEPAALHDRAPGYGIVELERATRRITFTNWPRYVDASKPGAKPYPGWPITIEQSDNGSV